MPARRAMTLASTSDAHLVERLIERDRSAFDDLYRLHAPHLWAVAYRLSGGRDEATEFVKQTFVRALSRLQQVDQDTIDLSLYLATTAKDVFTDGPHGNEQQAVGGALEESNTLPRQQEALRLASASLPPRQRLVLALFELEHRSYAEIGELTGSSEIEIAQLIAAARERLRAQLGVIRADRATRPGLCELMLPLLSAHHDNELTGIKLEETVSHLAGCQVCQNEITDLKELQRRYREFIPEPPAPDLFNRVDSAIAATGYWQDTRERRRRRRAVVALAAAALLALGLLGAGTGYLLTGPGRTRPDSEAAGIATHLSTQPPQTAPVAVPKAPAKHTRTLSPHKQSAPLVPTGGSNSSPVKTEARTSTNQPTGPAPDKHAATTTTPKERPAPRTLTSLLTRLPHYPNHLRPRPRHPHRLRTRRLRHRHRRLPIHPLHHHHRLPIHPLLLLHPRHSRRLNSHRTCHSLAPRRQRQAQ